MRNNPMAAAKMPSSLGPESTGVNMQTPARKQNRNDMTAAIRVNVLIVMFCHAFFRRTTIHFVIQSGFIQGQRFARLPSEVAPRPRLVRFRAMIGGCVSGFQRSHIDAETVFHIRLDQSLVGFVDFLDRDDLDVGGDVVRAAEVEHLLRFGDAADG